MNAYLSVCMIVKDEEKVLRRCLESIVGIADEIIIVDTGSIDKTKEIALEFTEKVFDHKWEDDFSKARNYAASKASGKWILAIDADEFVDRDSFVSFKRNLKENPPVQNILAIQIVNFVGINGKDTSLNYHERLYKNDNSICYYRSIHELLKHKDKGENRGFSDFRIFHSGYMESVVKEKEKSERNLVLLKNKKTKEPIDYYFIGNEYDSLGETDKAIKYYQKGFQLKEDINSDWVKKLLLRLVNTLHVAKRNNDALKVIADCEKIYPHLVDFMFYKGKIFFDRENFEESKLIFEEILSNKNDLIADSSEDFHEFLPHRYLGEIYEMEGELHKAVHSYSKALSMNDSDNYLWMKLINILGKNSSSEELVEFLNNNLLNKFNLNPLRIIKILLSVPLIEVQKLTSKFLKESELSLAEREALYIKNLFLEGDKNKVVLMLNEKSNNQIISILSTGIFNIIDFIIISLELNNKEYQEILFLIKYDTELDNLLNLLFNKKNNNLGDLEEELFISTLQQANVLGWKKVISHLESKVKYLTKDANKKIEKIESMVSRISGSIATNQSQDYIDVKKQLEILITKNHYKEALILIDESLRAMPSDTDLYSIKAVIFMKLQNFDSAKEILEKGLAVNPNHIDCLYNLAFIYEHNNHMNIAVEIYKNILHLTHEKELISEIEFIISNIQELLRQKEVQKRFDNSKYAKKQDLILKSDKSYPKSHIVYMLTHVGICGGVKVILEHANKLTKLGHKVSLVCHFPLPTWYPIEDNVKYIEVPFDIELSKGIPLCDVIVATYWDHIQACIDTEIAPVVYFEQGDFHLFEFNNMERSLKKFIYQQYQLPKFIFTVTNQAASLIEKLYNRKAKVIPNAVDSIVFNQKLNKMDIIEKPYILMMGDAQLKFKGLEQIINAYNKVKIDVPDIQLYWITPSVPPIEYENAVDKYFVAPSQHKIADLYRRAVMYVSASHYESFSLPVLEAMACGCPVVTTGNEGVLEYAKDNINVLITKIEDPVDISEKILRVLADQKLKKKLISNGLSTVAKFNWDNITLQLSTFYKEIAKYKVNI